MSEGLTKMTPSEALREFGMDMEPLVQLLLKNGNRDAAGLIQYVQGAANDKAHYLEAVTPLYSKANTKEGQ